MNRVQVSDNLRYVIHPADFRIAPIYTHYALPYMLALAVFYYGSLSHVYSLN